MTDPVQSRSNPLSFDPLPDAGSAGPLAPLAPGAKVGQADLDAAIDKAMEGAVQPTAASRANLVATFVRAQTAPVAVAAYTVDARSTAIQSKLDAFKQDMTPTYRMPDGSTVAVSAFFQMGPGGKQSPMLAANRGARDALASQLGVTSNFDYGRPDNLASIQKITQGLIDAGKLGPDTGDAALQVRMMAWSFGVGIDCAGYVQNALYASQGGDAKRYGLGTISNENLLGLAYNSKWTNVGIAGARPGDVMTLGEIRNGAKFVDFGHAVIVYEHQLAGDKERDALRTKVGTDAEALKVLGDPKLHIFQLDSSWGTGNTPINGAGVQRRTWLYGESTGWLCQRANGAFGADGPTPAGHTLSGPFRPKVQP
jgi:hypothetical protein